MNVTKEQALIALVAGALAIVISLFPFLFQTIRQFVKSRQDDNYSMIEGVFWIFITQYTASMFFYYAVIVIEAMDKSGKLKLRGADGAFEHFWTWQYSNFAGYSVITVKSIIAYIESLRLWFEIFNAILMVGSVALGMSIGWYAARKMQLRTNNRDHLMVLFKAFVGMVVAGMIYVAYTKIATVSSFSPVPVLDIARNWIKATIGI